MRMLHIHNSISVKQVLFLWVVFCLLPGIAQAGESNASYQIDSTHKVSNHKVDKHNFGKHDMGKQSVGKHKVCDKDGKSCVNSLTVPLLIDEQIQAGVVKVTYDEHNLTIKYLANDGWLIEATRLAVAGSFEGLPQDRYGNPKLRHFPYQTQHKKPVGAVTQTLSTKNWPIGTELYIAAQADVVAEKSMHGTMRFKAGTWSAKWGDILKTSGKQSGHDHDYKNTGSKAQSAWAKGYKFPGNKEGFYFTYLLQACEPVVNSTIQFKAAVFHGSEDEASAKVTVVRSGDLSQPATVQFSTTDGTALAGIDYATVETELTFNPNVTKLEMFIPIIDDSEAEEVESINLQLTNIQGATLGDQDTAVLEIADNDEAIPQLDVFIFEPAVYGVRESGDLVVVTVKRIGNLAGETTVDFAATGGSAISPRDYELMPGTLVFPDGVDTATITVLINEDRVPDGNVTVEISLANPINANLGSPSSALITIEDNETPN
ncbi:MAG TPA: Calx-beta domain-containing protein [Gammaproteobacteria bacterium]